MEVKVYPGSGACSDVMQGNLCRQCRCAVSWSAIAFDDNTFVFAATSWSWGFTKMMAVNKAGKQIAAR